MTASAQSTLSIESIKIHRFEDSSPDTSFIGEYTDACIPWAIDRAAGEYIAILEQDEDYQTPERGREYRYFVPYAGGEKQGTEDYQTYGKQDFARMESLQAGNWYFCGLQAVARIVVNGTFQTIASGGLWGIESDSDESYFAEIAKEELAQLHDQLTALGFSAEQIDEIEVEGGGA